MHIQTLSLNPFVAVIDDFFDADLANHLIESGKAKLARASVVNTKGGNMISDHRTNSAVPLDQWSDPRMTELATRLSTLLRLPPENAEPSQLLHYVKAQEYHPHSDAFVADTGGIEQLVRGGQRLFTTICYLNDVDSGGETEFPKLKIKVSPRLGRVLIFGNTRLGTAEVHPHSIHAGRPLGGEDDGEYAGEKWALTHWWRQLAYHVPRDYPAETSDTRVI